MAKKIVDKKEKAIYITWHYTTHGIAYLKHILTAFYRRNYKIGAERADNLDQENLQKYWDNEGCRVAEDGFLFEKVFYLHARDEVTAHITSRRRTTTVETDELMNKEGTMEIWREVYEAATRAAGAGAEQHLEDEMAQLKANYPEKWETLLEQYWRSMQYYSIQDQLYWWWNYGNGRFLYDENRFVPVLFDKINDLRDMQQIANSVRDFVLELKKKYADYKWVINTSLGTYEAQTVWYVLGEAGFLPSGTEFLAAYDDKASNTGKRFKLFSIVRQPVHIFTDIRQRYLSVYDSETLSESRKLAQAKFNHYLKQGFTLLLLGERGTGKTRLILDNKNAFGGKFAQANCASFDDDSKAEAELFGYEKGAFTGAEKDGKLGLFQQANGGLLFLDEVHNLSKRVQAKLMTALQTNENNEFKIRRMGGQKEETITCTVVFASNKKIEELREILYPDFFDRITQLIVEFPPLRESKEERERDWETIWKQLRFDEIAPVPKEISLMSWLKKLLLYGNYRDLQKIAIYYKAFLDLPDGEDKKLIINDMGGAKTAFDFAKREFERYYSRQNKPTEEQKYFSLDKKTKEMELDFKQDLAEWLGKELGTKGEIVRHFQDKHDEKITEKTLYNWENRHTNSGKNKA